MLSLPDKPWWHQYANCLGVDPSLFFGEPYEDPTEAKEVCRGCGVKWDCLEYALARPERHGVWGGVSEAGRRKILRQRASLRVRNDTVPS